MKFRHIIVIAVSVVSIITLISYQALKSSRSKDGNRNTSTTQQDNTLSDNPVDVYSTSPSTSPGTSDLVTAGEQVNKKGQRRPAQYVHICTTPDFIEYVSQGTPKCLGNDRYMSDYNTSVAGTVFSSPCQTTSGSLRYVYISTDETCPSGTKLLFYNNLDSSNSSSSL